MLIDSLYGIPVQKLKALMTLKDQHFLQRILVVVQTKMIPLSSYCKNKVVIEIQKTYTDSLIARRKIMEASFSHFYLRMDKNLK